MDSVSDAQKYGVGCKTKNNGVIILLIDIYGDPSIACFYETLFAYF